jgi:hypothetical protein
MRLPNAEDAIVDRRKLVGYLLARDHPLGRTKAAWFEAFGFSAQAWEQLAAALEEHAKAQPIARVIGTPYGTKFVLDGPLRSPDGRNPGVRTVWFIELGEDRPRFVTAYRGAGEHP